MTEPNAQDAYVGRRLMEVRQGRKLSIEAIACGIGISALEVAGIETGIRRLSAAEALNVCSYLRISPVDLYNGMPRPEALLSPYNDVQISEWFRTLMANQ